MKAKQTLVVWKSEKHSKSKYLNLNTDGERHISKLNMSVNYTCKSTKRLFVFESDFRK